jgi:serine/threonine-protein kinase
MGLQEDLVRHDSDTGGQAQAPLPDDRIPLAIGERVGGRYVIHDLLGDGAGGYVYIAHHAAVGTRVAIKVMRSGTDNWRSVERFRREATAYARVESVHVSHVFDAGYTDGGHAYIVMEYLDGPDLETILQQRGPLPIDLAVNITVQLLSALASVHRAGIVHRDVKPANIVLYDEASGEMVVKLVDFGISKNIDDGGDPGVTGEGMAVGTPHYMTPEQVRGERVDARTDLYSAGAVLYAMLTGHPPTPGETAYEVLESVLRSPVTPPRTIRPECPADLEVAVLRALSPRPHDRYPSAKVMAHVIRRAVDVPLPASMQPVHELDTTPAPFVAPPNSASTTIPFELRRPPERRASVDDASDTTERHPTRPALRKRWVWSFAAAATLLGATVGALWRPLEPLLPTRSSDRAPAAELHAARPAIEPRTVGNRPPKRGGRPEGSHGSDTAAEEPLCSLPQDRARIAETQ